MADEIETPELTDEETPEVDPIAQLKADFEKRMADQAAAHTQSLHQMNLQLAEAQGAYNASIASQQAGNKPTSDVILDASQDEIEAALEAGQYKEAARLMKLAANAASRRESAILRETEINPLRGTVEQVGLPAMASLTSRGVLSDLPEAARTFYADHKEAINAHIAKMPQQARVDPAAIQGAIAYEMGLSAMNGDLDNRINDEVERRIRSGNQPSNLKTGGGRQAGSVAVDYSKVFGDGAAAAVEDKGGFDQWAIARGYDDMADYCKKNGVSLQ